MSGPRAPRNARLAASFADANAAVLWILPAIALLLSASILGMREAAEPARVGVAFGVVGWQVWLAAGTAMRGQSYGKRVCGIRIVDAEGRPPGWIRGVAVRGFAIPGVALLLDLVGPGWGAALRVADHAFILLPGARCLHDLLAGTRVIECMALPRGRDGDPTPPSAG